MKKTVQLFVCGFVILMFKFSVQAQLPSEISQTYELTWSDEFDYPNNQLEQNWTLQNGPSNHILSGRYRDNAVVANGVLELQYKKENRGGQNWTSANLWTNKEYRYGYFECRYKYAAAGATNNSFWIMNRSYESITPPGRGFELDINEGHFPNEVNTNIHKFDVGFTNRTVDSKSYVFGIEAGVNLPLEIPITTKKIRFTSTNPTHFHLREFRIYNDNNRRFPSVLSETADTDVSGLVNHARASGTQITVSGTFDNSFGRRKENMVDGNVQLNSWVSQRDGQKWVEFEWPQNKTVGAIQFVNGWNGPEWKGIISNYKIEYWNGARWVEIAKLDTAADNNFAEEYHTYGFKWDENEFVWYFDGEEIRRTPNTHAFGFAPIWLSGAVIGWSGPVTDAIDGTSMKVDYVRVYKKGTNTGGSNESLTGINGPISVAQNQEINIKVDYNTTTARDIRVNFKSANGTLYGHQIKTVNGRGSQTFTITKDVLPPVGTGYQLQAYMSPVGGNWNNRIGDAIQQNNIAVTQQVVDALTKINGPTAITKNEKINVTVDYSTTTSRDIRVNFKSANGTLYGHQIKTVTGSGNETFSITTNNPPTGTNYLLQAYMSPVGGNWSTRIDGPIEKNNITVTAGVVIPIGSVITLKGSNGKFVSSENGNSGMNCNRTSAQGWENFTVVNAGEGKIALKGNNGQYVSSNNGNGAITCDRSSIGDWEKFTWGNNNGSVTLKGNNGKYISSENGLKSMTCVKSSVGTWERFNINTTSRALTLFKNQYNTNKITMFPNPLNTGILHIDFNRPTIKNIEMSVIDLSGRTILLSTFNGNGLQTKDVSALPKGIYMVHIKDNKGIQKVQKLIIK